MKKEDIGVGLPKSGGSFAKREKRIDIIVQNVLYFERKIVKKKVERGDWNYGFEFPFLENERMRKTKIICTLGPKSNTYETIKAMALAGMNVARINMSHGSYQEHKEKIDLVKRVRQELGIALPVMIDTKGPETRIKTFKNGKVDIRAGQQFIFTPDDVEGDEHIVSVNYENLHQDLKAGGKILLNNGLVVFKIDKIVGTKVYTTAMNAGTLSDHKSMYFPGVVLNLPYMSEADVSDLSFAIEQDADFIAASFVSTAFDVRELRSFLRRKKATHIDIIAKIESAAGVENIESIMKESDGIMVARGDMGVEIPFEKLPAIQKQLVKKGRMLGKRVIVATEMLESMIENPRPTRAEISDVANAVYDGASCIMLSGETAVGRDPEGVVKTMARIARETENDICYNKRFKNMEVNLSTVQDAISHATCNTCIDIGAKAIVAFTSSGRSARMISRFRQATPILGITMSERVYRKLGMSWNVLPMLSEQFTTTDDMFAHAKKCAVESGYVKEGDLIVIAAGIPVATGAPTNLIKVETV